MAPSQVTLADGSTWDARFVGGEPDKDLAVLKINAPRHNSSPCRLAPSRDLAVGQKVFAIGNPFSLDQTLTTGVISGLGREIPLSHGSSYSRRDPDRCGYQPGKLWRATPR